MVKLSSREPSRRRHREMAPYWQVSAPPEMPAMTYAEIRDSLIGECGTTTLLKQTVEAFDFVDPLNALLDAEALLHLMRRRRREASLMEES